MFTRLFAPDSQNTLEEVWPSAAVCMINIVASSALNMEDPSTFALLK